MDSLQQYAVDYSNYYNNNGICVVTHDSKIKNDIYYTSFIEEENKLKQEAIKGTTYIVFDNEPSMVLAARTGNIQIVKLLLERGVNPNITSWSGSSPLSEACTHNHKDIVMLLLEGVPPNYCRADIESTDDYGDTLLCQTLSGCECHIEIAKILIEHGADYKIICDNGNTIMEEFECEYKNLIEKKEELKKFIEEFESRGINIKGASR